MKKSTLTPTLICALLVTSACPSFAQFQGNTSGNTSGSSSNTMAPQFTAPNYWGDARVKNKSTAANSQGSGMGQQQQSGGSRGGGSSMGMFMGPAMMLPMMLMARGFGRGGRPHYPKPKDDDDQKSNKHHNNKLSSRAPMQPSVNDENSLPDPLYPTQGMSALSKKTLDMQTGNGQSAIEEHKKNVYGNMQDDEGPVPGMASGMASGTAPGMLPETTPAFIPETAPGTASEAAPGTASETAPGTDF